MHRRRVGAVAAWAVVTCVVSTALQGCLSPTLPVPPPAVDALQEPLAELLPDGKTMQITGTDALGGGIVTLWNEETHDGEVVQANDRGVYETRLGVDLSCLRPRNHITLWQTDQHVQNSPVKTYRLPNRFPNALPPENAINCVDGGLVDAGAVDDGGVE